GEECGPCFDRRQEKGGEDPTPQRPLTLQGHRGGVDGVGFAAGGKKLVSVGWGTQGDDWGGTLIVWDVAKGVEKAEQVVDPFMGDLVIPFACNGKHAAVGEYEATRLFDARTGKPTFEGLGGQL